MEAFGQTETAPTVITFPGLTEARFNGCSQPMYKMDLLTWDGRSAEDGEQGEIVFYTDEKRPLSLFMGYYRKKNLPGRSMPTMYTTRATWHGATKRATTGSWGARMM